jgi:sterol desaturase/sphingolipid hydroxylase (fatty acid hydroxylase superfamily)
MVATATIVPTSSRRARPRSRPRRIVATGALVVAVLVAARAGYRPAGGVLLGFLLLTPLERLFRRHDQPVRRPGLRTDVVHLLITSTLATVASVVPVIVGFVVTRPLPRLDVLVGQWPLGVQFVWAVLWIELAVYWAHRLLHRVPLFWRFHKVHHSSPRLDWIAGARVHPFDRAIGVSLAIVPALLLGVRPIQFGAFAAIQGVLAVLLHANVRWRLRPLGRIVATTEFHHWHHSLGDDARNANYAAFLPIFDVIFGTFHLPADARPERYGVWDHVPPGWWAQLKDPFRNRANRPTVARGSFDGLPVPF